MSTYEKIMDLSYSFPWFFDGTAKAIITELLTTEPEDRLGSEAGVLNRGDRQLREHAFFQAINFLQLERRELDAPLIPNITSSTDTSNFGAIDEDDDEVGQEERLIRGSLLTSGSIRPTGSASSTDSSVAEDGSFSFW